MKIIRDKQGQAFSLDVMLALIIITVIIGVSADAMDITSYKMREYSARFSLERTTTDAADILIKTSGSPDNWEIYNLSFLTDVTPGLAKINITTGRTVPNTLAFRKIDKLSRYYDDLMYGTFLPIGSNSSMIIYPINPNLEPITILNKTPSTNISDIAVANRTVLCEYMHLRVVIDLNVHRNPAWPVEPGFEWEICPHINLTGNLKHEQPDLQVGKAGWACHHFNITRWDLDKYDFYVITDPANIGDNSARWIIDRPENPTDDRHKFDETPYLANDIIASVLGTDEAAELWFHVLTAGDPKRVFDAYLVSVPKGTPQDQVQLEYLNPQPCFFVLRVWM